MSGVCFYVCNDTLNSAPPPMSRFECRCQQSSLNECTLCSFVCFGPRSCLRCGIIWSNNSFSILIRVCVRMCVRGASVFLCMSVYVNGGCCRLRPSWTGATLLGSASFTLAPCPAFSFWSWQRTGRLVSLSTDTSLASSWAWHSHNLQPEETLLHKGHS